MGQRVQQDVQRNEFRCVGMSRSGNHAIINWIISQLPGHYCFLNCAEPKQNPFTSARPLREWGESYRTNIPGFDLSREQRGQFSEKDYLLYSYEDCFLGGLNHPQFRKNRERWIGRSGEVNSLLILRDPFNLFASRIRAGLLLGHYTHGTKPISIYNLRRIWKQHAREFLGERRYLKRRVLVNFNRWTEEKAYRADIVARLGIPFTDRGFNQVSDVAGGSSFDGLRLMGRADQMDLQNRWRAYEHDERYWELFDDELVELTRKIFGEIAPVRYYEAYGKQAETG